MEVFPLVSGVTCPECHSKEYIHDISSTSICVKYKCYNCNSYFNFNDIAHENIGPPDVDEDIVSVVICSKCKFGIDLRCKDNQFLCTKPNTMDFCHDGYYYCRDGVRRV